MSLLRCLDWTSEQAGIQRERGYGGDSLGASNKNCPVSLVPPVSLLVDFPD